MRIKLRILLLAILLIGIGLYYSINQVNINQDSNQTETIPQDSGEIEDHKEIPEIDDSDEEDHIKEEHLTTRISNAFRETLRFFFTQEFHVVAIGDSLTQGVGDSSGNGGYIGILDQTINEQRNIVTFDNFGKSGRRTDQLLEVLQDPEVISSIEQTDIVLMTIGANDIMRVVQKNFTNLTYSLFTEERIHFEQRLNQIFMNIRRINPNAHIYLLGLYNPFKQYFQDIEELDLIVSHWNQTGINTTAKFDKTTFIPIKDVFDDTVINLFAEDHFHPNKFGYERMAERVLKYLTNGEG